MFCVLFCFLFSLPHEPNGSGVCLCWSRCACRAARTIRAEPPAPPKRALNRTACLGLSAGKPRQSPARHRSPQAESQTGAPRPGAVGFPVPPLQPPLQGEREAGRAGRCPRRSRCALRTSAHTRARGAAHARREPQPCPQPGSPQGAGARLETRQATLSLACPCRIPVAAGRRPTRPARGPNSPRWRRRRKGEAEARCRPGAAEQRSEPSARKVPPPASPPAPERGTAAPLTCF